MVNSSGLKNTILYITLIDKNVSCNNRIIFYGCIKAKLSRYWKWNCSRWRGVPTFYFTPPPLQFAMHLKYANHLEEADKKSPSREYSASRKASTKGKKMKQNIQKSFIKPRKQTPLIHYMSSYTTYPPLWWNTSRDLTSISVSRSAILWVFGIDYKE